MNLHTIPTNIATKQVANSFETTIVIHSTMGQDREEAAEIVATIRGEHTVMKNWFMGDSKEAAELRKKYGDYPGLWKEVLNWPGWKEARKAYLQFTQTNGNNTGEDKTNVPRKRRSRWGSAKEDDNKSGAESQDGGPSNKRRSRWDRSNPPASSNPTNGGTAPPVIPTPLPGLGLPGIPSNLAPQEQEEVRRHQGRLREINDKLGNLEMEAARVDALPRGHPDRSPSPPPGKLNS